MKSYQDQIDEIMDWFNFEKVHETMVAVDWRWYRNHNLATPTVQELRQEARKLLKAVSDRKMVAFAACGGLQATRSSEGTLKLQFVVTEWDSEKEEEINGF